MDYWVSVMMFCVANFLYQWLPIGDGDYAIALERSLFQVCICAYMYFRFFK